MPDDLLKKRVFSGRVLDVNLETHPMPDGRHSEFEVVRHPGGAAVLPILADGRVVLLRQYRPALGKMIYEIPAGRLEPGESPGDCAARELQEEAGYRAGAIRPLGGLWSTPGFCDEYIYLFLASDLTEVEQQLEEDELIELCIVSMQDAIEMVAGDDILDSKTQLALLRYHYLMSGETL